MIPFSSYTQKHLEPFRFQPSTHIIMSADALNLKWSQQSSY